MMTDSTTPALVSVIIPTYNRAALLREAVASVCAQSYPRWELIVIDDGSTDETGSMLAELDEPRLRVVRVEHFGHPGKVRNAGLAVATGDYVAFLDDDDLWLPEKLATQLRLLEDGRFRWSYTGYLSQNGEGTFTSESHPDRIRSGSILRALLELEAAVALPTVMAERALIETAGRFDEAMRIHQDYALWLDLAALTEVVATPDHLTIVRDHPGRMYRPEAYRFMVALYKKWYGRVTDPALRDICRRRLAENYLVAARRRWRITQAFTALSTMLGALRWDPPYTLRRLLDSLARRVSGCA